MEYLNTYLAVFLLFLSKVLAEGETKGYLRREHSVLKGEFDVALVNCAPNPSWMWLLHSQGNFRERFDEFAFLDSISCRCKLRSLRVRSFSYEEFFLHLFVPKPNLTSSVNENVTGFNIVILKSGTANIQSVPMSHVTCMWRPLQRYFFFKLHAFLPTDFCTYPF